MALSRLYMSGATLSTATLATIFGAVAALGQALDHDSSLPIEITADSLEVVQEEQIATFAGDVDAVQGDLVLSADTLRVYYEGEGGNVGVATGTASAIRKIEAVGDVIIASPEETARGDFGNYDVLGKLITIEGAVVLTRDDNVIRGQRLELDLVSGKSRMVGTDDTAVSSDTEEAVGTRVRALFTPKQREGGDKPAEGADAPTPHIPAAKPE